MIEGIAALIAVVGVLGVVLLCMWVSAYMLERILRLAKLYHCFFDFMVAWVRSRHDKKGGECQPTR